MRFGIFGCRHYHIATAVAQMLALGHSCIGVYEPEGPLAAKLVQKYHLNHFSDAHGFFAAGPEIVLCAAVNCEKIHVVEECAAHGAHVMLDKPLVTSMSDLERLERILATGKVQIGLMLTERFNPAVLTLKDLIDRGALGKLVGVTFSKPHKLSPEKRESWHFDKSQNGGPIIDLMVHDIDLLRWFTGSEIEQTAGFMKKGDRPGYPNFFDDAKLVVAMQNGVTAVLTTDWWTPSAYPCFGKGRIVCTGTRGKAEAYTTGEPLINKKEFVIFSDSTVQEQLIPCVLPQKNLMEDFLDRLAGRPALITQYDILQATRASLAADAGCHVLAAR